MKITDKHLILVFSILATIIFIFVDSQSTKFIFLIPLIFLFPGYLVLTVLDRKDSIERLIFGFVLSIGLFGIIALLLALFAIMSTDSLFLSLITLITFLFILSDPTILKFKKSGMEKGMSEQDRVIVASLIALCFLVAVFGYNTFTAQEPDTIQYYLVDKIPDDIALNSPLLFDVNINSDYSYPIDLTLVTRFEESTNTTNFSLQPDGDICIPVYVTATSFGNKTVFFDLYIGNDFYATLNFDFEVP